MNPISRFRVWWRTVWAATTVAFGGPTYSFQVKTRRKGLPVDWSNLKQPAWFNAPEDELGMAATRPWPQ